VENINPIYHRKEGETDFEWKLRLVNLKLDKLIDLDWSEIVVILGLECSGDHLRKLAYGYRECDEYYRNQIESKVLKDKILSKTIAERESIEREKIKLKDQRKEFRKLLVAQSRFEYIKEFITETALQIAKQKPLEWIQCKPSNGYKEGAILLSDWHSETEIENFLNKFNKEEFLRRFNKLTMKTIEYGKLHNIKVLHVCNLNDLLTGLIHFTSRVAANEDTVTQTMIVGDLLAEMLVKFANEFEKVKFYSVLDNHSRVNPNKDEAIKKESFARFLPWYMKARLQNISNIEVVDNSLDEDIMVTDICGYSVFMVHGNKDNLKNVVQDLALMIRKFPDYIFTSHLHHNIEDEVHSCEIIVNPCLMGTDEYAIDKRKSSKPAQKFLVFTPEVGRECTYNIRLDR
jgi:hypothetical protein